MIQTVGNLADFSQHLAAAGEKLVVVNCFNSCQELAHLEETSKSMEDVVFLNIDVIECEAIISEYKVSTY